MDSRVEKKLFFKDCLLDHIANEAHRLDTSLSWNIQKAWLLASIKIEALSAEEASLSFVTRWCEQHLGDNLPTTTRAQTVFLPQAMLNEINVQAQRLDVSSSLIVQLAWVAAAADIRALSAQTR